MHLSALALGSLRWWLLLRSHGLRYRARPLFVIYLISAFFNNFLPTSAGGDLLRMYHIYRQDHGIPIAVSPIITERVLGLFSLVSIASAALLLIDMEHPLLLSLRGILPAFWLAMAGGLIMLSMRRSIRLLRRLLSRWLHRRPVDALVRIAESIHTHLRHRALIAQLLALSLFIHVIVVTSFIALGHAAGVPIDVSRFLIAVPLLLASSALPISIGGLGVREAAGAALFVALGMPAGQAAAVVLLYVPLLLISTLPGLVLYLRMKDHRGFLKRASRAEAELTP